ncbi:MAG: sodium/proton-translocating pyrophosphatase [Clostridiales bacterium]|nr:sodium/proton-translocating pyrophosphatase [Clostridiales bacterium]
MLKIITLLCALLAVLVAILSEAWLRSKRGQGDIIGRIYGILRGRNINFIMFQYPAVLIAVVIVGAAIGIATSWKSAAVYGVGAAVCCVANLIGSSAYVSGGTASAYAALNGDIRHSLKSAFRSGEVLGACITSIGLICLGALFVLLKVETAINVSVSLAFGASTAAALINVGGRVYSAAYTMASSGKDFNDTAGEFAGTGAELFESYIAAAASVMLLAQSASDMSGLNAMVSLQDAARFPLIIFASGIVASLAGNLFFNIRAGIKTAGSVTLSCIIAGAIESAAALYFSFRFFGTIQYGLPIVTGVVCGLILGEILKFFSGDSKVFIRNRKSYRKLGSQVPSVFNMGSGMMSSIIPAALLVIALVVSSNIAFTYGVALCAVGFISMTISFAAVSGLSIISGTVSGAVQSTGDDQNTNAMADVLETASVRTEMPARSYLLISSAFTIAAVLFAFMNSLGGDSIDITQPFYIAGMFAGIAVPFMLMGMILFSVRLTARVALRSLDRSDDDTGSAGSLRGSMLPVVCAAAFPTFAGLFFGQEILTAFLCASAFTAIILEAVYNDSGRYYRNSAAQALASLVKFMLLFSIAFSSVFARIGGFLFQ